MKEGMHFLVSRMKLAPIDSNLHFISERVQFPLRLFCSLTIIKAQGPIFIKFGIYLPHPVFS
uniref:Uncharacterized protein n=1 Tax=Octopus bimaculoides TaxID=37653 RepID=A0A0L8GQ80_OCTBM